jgi:hypothetical protein
MIIETSSNQLYAVTETGDARLAHVWNGIRVRRAKIRGTYEAHPKANRIELVRKAGSRIVSQFKMRD